MERTILLSVDPDLTSNYSVSLNKQSGTFSYSGIYPVWPALKQIIGIQGLAGTIERITPNAGPSEAGRTIEGRMLPAFQREFLSVDYPERDDGRAYYVSDIISAIATKAGTTVTFSATNNPMKSYKFTGRFVDAMTSLAQEACGELIQQNQAWYVIPKDTSRGTFSVPVADLISCRQSSQSDIMDQLMGIISSIRSLYDELYQIAKRKGELEAELARILNDEDNDVTIDATSLIAMGPISFEFGCGTSETPTPVPNNIVIEGGTWETFTPEAGKSLNPDDPSKKYYQVKPVLSNGQPTGAMSGCTSLTNATLLYPANEPSNASGIYYAKGSLLHLTMTAGGYAGSENITALISPEYRAVTQYDSSGDPKLVRLLYFGFLTTSGNSDIDDDQSLYRGNLELSYKPATVQKWRFTGSLDDCHWAITKAGAFNGYIGFDGIPHSITGTVLPKITNVDQIDGILMYENVIRNSSGAIVGSIDSTNVVRNATRQILGTYSPQFRTIALNNKPTGFVQGGYVYLDWPGIDPVTEPTPHTFPIYLTEIPTMPLGSTEDDVENATKTKLTNEIAKLALDQLVANAKITCLTTELTKYGASALVPYIQAATDAWHRFYDTQEGQTSELPQETRDLIAALETAAAGKDDELMVAMNLITAILVDVDITFLYNASLPMPANALSITGTMPGFSQDLDCGIINSINFNGYAVTVRAQKYGTR